MDGNPLQSEAGGAANDVWFHIRMKEEARLQQETIGDMGVNLIFGAFFGTHVNELLISVTTSTKTNRDRYDPCGRACI